MAIQQAEKVPQKVIKKLEDTVSDKNRVEPVYKQAVELQKKLKKQKRMAADKKLFKELDELEDVEGKKKLHKTAEKAFKMIRLELETLDKTMKILKEAHAFLANVAKKEAQPLEANFKKLAARKPGA